MKRVLSTVLAAILLAGVLFSVPLTAGAETLPDFAASPFGDSTAVRLWKNDADGAYYLFLPGGTDPAALTPRFAGEAAVDGTALTDGSPTDALTPGEHTLKLGETECKLYVLVSSDMPSVFLTTESGSMDAINADKEHKEKGTITVVEDGAVTMEAAALKSVKGRGNMTWTYPKKPYNIKFDKKTDLFGMGKAKKWSLLANWTDDTLMRNSLAFDLADRFDIPFTGKRQPVDLYANGEYLGSYLVCESVEVGETRVDIPDLDSLNEDANPDVDDIEALPQGGTGSGNKPQDGGVKGSMKWVNVPNDPENITGGYLMEVDFLNRYNEEISGFVSKQGQCVTLKSPEFASQAEVRYIAGLWNEMEEAVLASDGVNGKGRRFTDYLDVEVFAKTYLLEELTMDIDAGLTSFYFYKDADSDKFVAAPVWDFDRSLGTFDTRAGVALNDPGKWYANGQSYSSFGLTKNDIESMLTLVFKHEEIRDAAADAWKASGISEASTRIDQALADSLAALESSFVMDAIRWGKGTFAELDDVKAKYTDAGNALRSFITDRIATLDYAFAEPAAMLYYDGNGVAGHLFNREIVRPGESVTVLPSFVDDVSKLKPNTSKYRFKCWNTQSDGSGTDYNPGDMITLNARTTNLYAQWHTVAKVAAKPATCTETGLTAGEKCAVCGEILKAQKSVPALGHTPKTVPTKAPTCIETGLTAGEKCAVCGEVLSGLETIPTIPHTPEAVPEKPATCAETGLTAGEKCAVCGEVLSGLETIPALPHTPETVIGKPATCTEDGVSDGEVCAVCGEVLKAQEIVPATGHTPGATPVLAPTCTETGLTSGEVCFVCGEVLKPQETLPALGHTAPDDDGKCARCGAQIAEPKPKGLRGDADLDGKVLAKDARLVLRASARLEKLEGQAFINCDLDGSGRLTAREARLILRYSARLEKTI